MVGFYGFYPVSLQIKYSKAYQVPPTEELQFGDWGRICGVKILKILICLLGLYSIRMYVCILITSPARYLCISRTTVLYASFTEPNCRCSLFIDNVIAPFHEVSEVLIVLSPGVLISAWSMCPSFLLLRLQRSVRCSCVDPMSTRGWQLIFIKAAVGEAETWGHLKGMHLASLKILCYLSLRLTGWWYGLAQIRKLCSHSEIFHLL